MPFIASMGIYVVKASIMKELLLERFPEQHDFGSDIIPGAKDLGFKIQVRNAACCRLCRTACATATGCRPGLASSVGRGTGDEGFRTRAQDTCWSPGQGWS